MYRRFIIKLMLLILIVGCFLFTGCGSGETSYYEASETDNTEKNAKQDTNGITESETVDFSETTTEDLFPVYVCGAVREPGVYYLNAGAINAEALEAAGGLIEGAAVDYVNLADSVVSGEKLYFPYEDELELGYNVIFSDDSQTGKQKLININTATKEELMTLPGIGESKADAIITYRENNGPFQNVEDITNISGIKNGVYNNIKEYIVVN